MKNEPEAEMWRMVSEDKLLEVIQHARAIIKLLDGPVTVVGERLPDEVKARLGIKPHGD